MENQLYITELHQDHQDWKKKLAFYEDELKIMKNRLAEVSAKNTDTELKMKVEQFQNRFIIQKNEIDELKHAIQAEEKQLTLNVQNNPVASDHRKLGDNATLRDRINTFEPLFISLREEFNLFIAESL